MNLLLTIGRLRGGDDDGKDGTVEIAKLMQTLTEPFSFRKGGREFAVGPSEAIFVQRHMILITTHQCRINSYVRYQDSQWSHGRADLGWCVEVRVRILEGKHHQIRRAVKRAGFLLLTLQRVQMAGVLSIEMVPCPGDCRWLTAEELWDIKKGLGLDQHGDFRVKNRNATRRRRKELREMGTASSEHQQTAP